MLSATFNLGDEGDPVTDGSDVGGDRLDDVYGVGGSLTFDDSHTRGRGLAVRHEVDYRGNSYYGWDDSFSWSPTWFGRVYIWFDSFPEGSVRLVRARGDQALRFAIDLLPSGRLSVRDSWNRSIGTMSEEILTGGWVRVEWMVNHLTGSVEVLLFNSPNIPTPTDMIVSASGQAIGPDSDEVQIGRSGSQRSSVVFWTDDPAISTVGYPGPV